jgi:hypothetical protein
MSPTCSLNMVNAAISLFSCLTMQFVYQEWRMWACCISSPWNTYETRSSRSLHPCFHLQRNSWHLNHEDLLPAYWFNLLYAFSLFFCCWVCSCSCHLIITCCWLWLREYSKHQALTSFWNVRPLYWISYRFQTFHHLHHLHLLQE